MGMSQEQAAAAAIQAAKFAQKMALERNLDKLPPNFFPPQLDISKITGLSSGHHDATKNLNLPNVTIEPANHSSSGSKSHGMSGSSGMDRHDRHSPERNSMMSMNNNNSSNTNNNNLNNFNKEESSADERNMSDDESSIAVN
jgi:hypothetical protein